MLEAYSNGLLQTKGYRILKRYITSGLKKFNLTLSQWAVLGQIYERKEMRLAEIAEVLSCEAPLATNIADQLEQKKLVSRYDDPKDRRAKLIKLTSKGKSLVPRVEGKAKDERFVT